MPSWHKKLVWLWKEWSHEDRFPMMKDQQRKNSKEQANSPNPNAPKKNLFYAFQSRVDEDTSPDVVTGM